MADAAASAATFSPGVAKTDSGSPAAAPLPASGAKEVEVSAFSGLRHALASVQAPRAALAPPDLQLCSVSVTQ